MNVILSFFRGRTLRLLGGFLVFTSLSLLIFLVLLDIFTDLVNPYLGIIIYMVLPTLLAIGLLLVPLDAWMRRRRVRAGVQEPEYPVIDLCDPAQRRIIGFFAVSGVFILIVLTVVTYKAVEFMDTVTFCGQVCHRVMRPQFVAYQRSPHASVPCIDCHIGPGAPWFVRAKLSGIPQVYHYTLRTYPRPIPTPVPALRPSRDTCENCHWPERFYGDVLRTDITYATDQENTQDTRTMIVKVGSGGQLGTGIHSHIVSQMWYLPANERRTEIAWVYVERPDGTAEQFVNPQFRGMVTPLGLRERRFMDCIDCHNRPAHHFDRFEDLVDSALTQGVINREIPFIKREIMASTGEPVSVPTEEEQQATIRRIRNITSIYRDTMPEIYQRWRPEIDDAVHNAADIYANAVFPHMRVGPETYPDWLTHDGCFRCHGPLVGEDDQQIVSRDCDLCHSIPE